MCHGRPSYCHIVNSNKTTKVPVYSGTIVLERDEPRFLNVFSSEVVLSNIDVRS